MEFANIEFLLLFILIIPYLIWIIMFRKKSEPTLRMADTNMFRFTPKSWKIMVMPILEILRLLAFSMIIIVMARPQTHNIIKNESVEGIDIMLSIDVSTSMLAEDLRDDRRNIKNRLDAAKEVASTFIAGRPNDNIGLTIFAGEAFTQCPMTIDHASLLSLLRNARTDMAAKGMIEDGTAIGMGLANALSRLKDSKAKSKVVILLTDGINNSGELSPMTSAEIAQSLGVRVYTIGVGSNGTAPYPVIVGGHTQYMQIPVEIDTQTLTDIANITQGKFFRAKNAEELYKVYAEIDKLEKSKIDVQKYNKRYEDYQEWALIALCALFFELLLRITLFRRIP